MTWTAQRCLMLDHLVMPQEDSLVATLRAATREDPGREFVRIAGQSFDRRSALDRVEATARGLRALGVRAGDRVGLMCGNLPEALWTWLGANAASAIDVPFNAEARGRLLAYFVADADPKVLVGTEEYLQILADTIEVSPEVVVCIGEHATQPFGGRARHVPFDELLAIGASSGVPLEDPGPDETATIMYTSGTTGPSKGVMLPQRYYVAKAADVEWLVEVGTEDIFYCVQPLFHIDGRTYVASAALERCTLALGSRFSVSRFWDEVREHGATIFGTIGTMLWMLHKQPPKPNDADLPARAAVCSSSPKEILREFEARFGVQITEAYGMTECVIITGAPPGETVPGRVGRPVPGVQVRVVDDHDVSVERGEIGELVYRTDEPSAMMQGYWRKPAETVEAWRNLWFHTGDLVREDAAGYIEYIGRKKDSIRRRGENVSAWEVEEAAVTHSSVLEAAAIGVPSDVGEEDVAILVVPKPGESVDPSELIQFLATDLPRFAVPRYVEIVESLPKTPSERIEKAKVRERGITDAAWDSNDILGRR